MAATSLVGTPLRLALLFALLVGTPLAGLGWLGTRFLAQQAGFDQQQAASRLESAASLLVREVDRTLEQWEAAAASALKSTRPEAAAPAPAGTTLLVLSPAGLVRAEGVRLPYYPATAAPPVVRSAALAAAQDAEFRERDFARAGASYRELARARDPETRAVALAGLARCLRQQGKVRDARGAYDELALLGPATVAGSPAPLVADFAQMNLYKEVGQADAAAREASSIAAALEEGRFQLDRATFDYFAGAAGFPGTAQSRAASTLATAEAAIELWEAWQRQPQGRAATTGRSAPVAAVWQHVSSGGAASAVSSGGFAPSTAVVIGPMDV